jgi:hypothetical protein
MKPISLCVPPRRGELCAPVRLWLTGERTVLELTARHRVTGIEVDAATGEVAVLVDITDPATARPVHVRFDLLALDTEATGRTVRLAEIERGGEKIAVFGTYLGVVSEEN